MGGFEFLQPVFLWGLLALPAIWYLLRVTPPMAQYVSFPAFHFLQGLNADQVSPAKTPLWLVLLRMAVVALVVIALARPIYSPPSDTQSVSATPSRGQITRIIIDNGWGAARNWPDQQKAALNLAFQAHQASSPLMVMSTAPLPGQKFIPQPVWVTYNQAVDMIKGLRPYPWPADYHQSLTQLQNLIGQKREGDVKSNLKDDLTGNGEKIFWLTDSLGDESHFHHKFAAYLASLGDVFYVQPAQDKRAIWLNKINQNTYGLYGFSPDALAQEDVFLNVISDKNRTMSRLKMIRNTDLVDETDNLHEQQYLLGQFILDKASLPDAAILQLADVKTAGTTWMLPRYIRPRQVGIVTNERGDQSSSPYTKSDYYLSRAISPFANVSSSVFSSVFQSDLTKLLAQNIDILILADRPDAAPAQQAALQEWVDRGGVLIYMAGPQIAQNPPSLSPIDILKGGRAIGGVMTWETSPKIEEFPENSPFYNLNIPDDISISQMVLAQPEPDLRSKIWAQLDDGTPFVTHHNIGRGHVVFFHTTATPQWSNFALSGLYVDMFERLIKWAEKFQASSGELGDGQVRGRQGSEDEEQGDIANRAAGPYRPQRLMDGFGAIYPAPPSTQDIYIHPQSGRPDIGSSQPPGIYYNGQDDLVLNLADHIDISRYAPADDLPSSFTIMPYDGQAKYHQFMPILWMMAIGLFLVDWVCMIWMGGGLARLWGKLPRHISFSLRSFIWAGCIGLAVSICVIGGNANKAHADITGQTNDQAILYAGDVYMAYIKTPNQRVNDIAQIGLARLGRVMASRTSVEPAGVVGIDLETDLDSLGLFPLLYWPVTSKAPDLTQPQQEKIRDYLNRGGMILFDTQDQAQQYGAIANLSPSPNAERLTSLLSPLNLPAIAPITSDHVLTRSFYLLDEFPGQYTGGTLWVEQASINPEERGGLDGVTRILIGAHDWASAWAANDADGYSLGEARLNNDGTYEFGQSGQQGQLQGFSNGYSRSFRHQLDVPHPASRQQELAFRFGINLMIYAMTGNYKADQIHIPFILERLDQ